MIYGAKSIIRFDRFRDEDGDPAFEERVVLLHAENQNHALELAEQEASLYAQENDGVHLDWVAVYEARDSTISFEGTQEVYSVMRCDDSSDEDYLSYFHDTGSERTTHYSTEQNKPI